ncbi:DNA polymerase III subunit tau [Saezia sanguinis]|uniref:DNA polymerase III subunit gamma/tau n=1 Tax=Saezia sanguinis TaxID=1965230 RepID=A0A433SA81_9BURK|nr:DNA polymerase III subunit gamma/tau [Saezia sanguinis]RUS65653.1 DNA polymerase III subunit tau [Saezia sanguinis]
MSYLVLARKYRPKTFSEMVGQDHVVQALTNALQTQRLHHAYLFTGTRGVGKTTVSRILAKSLNCVGPDGQGGITSHPCGVCQACLDIDAGRFVDYVELDAASNRGVDEISQLLEQAVYKPVVGRFKVFMIDEVHMLSNTAFNAMLKTLEEPPEYLKFVLATTDPQKVPVTVLSRCLQFNLRPMAPETVFEHLQQVLSAEQIPFDAGSLRLLSRAAHGSMRDALSLTDQAIAYGNGTMEENGVRQMLGSIDRSHVYQLIESLAAGNGKAVIELVDFMRTQGLAATAALDEMATVLQRMAVLQVVPDALQAGDPDDAAIAALASLMAPDEIQLLYSIVLRGQDELGLASDEYAALVMVLLRLLAFQPAGQATIPATGAGTAEKKTPQLTPRPVPPVSGAEQKAASQPVVSAPTPIPIPSPVSTPAHAPIARQAGAESASNAGQTVAQPVQASPRQEAPVSVTTQVRPVSQMPRPSDSGGGNLPERAAPQPEKMDSPPPQAVAAAVEDDLPPWVDEVPHEEGSYTPSAPYTAPAAGQSVVDQGDRESKDSLHKDKQPQNGAASYAGTGGAVQQPAYSETAGGMAASAARDTDSAVPVQPVQPIQLPESTPQAQRWTEVVNALVDTGAINALARELALNAQAVQISSDEQQWELVCARKTLMQDNNRQKLADALQAYLAHPVAVTVAYGEVSDTPALRIQAFLAQRQAQAQAAVEADQDVQKWLQEFPGARVVPGTVRPLE